MASRAKRKTITTIALARGVADTIKDSYPGPDGPPKTPKKHLDRVFSACDTCFDLWPDQLTPREIERIKKVLTAMEGRVQSGNKAEAVAISALAVMLTSDLATQIPADQRRQAIISLRQALLRLNKYYDRHLSHWHAYDAAASTVRQIDKMIENHEL